MGKSKTDYKRLYVAEHDSNPKRFSGHLSMTSACGIAELVNKLKERRRKAALSDDIRLLDWGSGKGYQYLRDRAHFQWGGILPHCYDIGVRQLWEKPFGKFDGIICTDVLEHIAKPDLPEFLEEMLGYLHMDQTPVFAYFNISVRPAGKRFPDGRNVHFTVETPHWWNNLLNQYAQENLEMVVEYEDKVGYNLQ